MRGLRRLPAGTLVAIAGVALAAGVLHASEAKGTLPPVNERLLYLRSGATASRVFMSFRTIAADVYWIRTIQHYGRDLRSSRTSDRFALLYPLLDLTTSLDPHFNLAYRFGAIFLAASPDGPGRPDQAIALLEKGLAANPGRWQYSYDIGLIHYLHTGRYAEAAAWFDKAAAMPGAPSWIRPLAAMTREIGGDRQGAQQLYEDMLGSDQPFLRKWAERGLAQLDALNFVDLLQARVEDYHAAYGRYPASWKDLMDGGLIRRPPVDPTGALYDYDPASHVVSISPESSLALPRVPAHQ